MVMFLELAATSSILLASGTATAPAPENWCAPTRPPTITVGLTAENPKGDYTKTMADLATFHIDTQSPYGAGVETHVGGLTDGAIGVSQKITLGGYRRGDESCLWYDKIEVTISLAQTVYVAKDFPPNSCRFKSVWDHEHKHIRIDREILNEYYASFDRAVREAAIKKAVVGPISYMNETSARTELVENIKQILNATAQRMEKDREVRQQGVDTRVEYDRVKALCPGE